METLTKFTTPFNGDVARTICDIQEFVYRCQSFFYNKRMDKDRKLEFMQKWLDSIFYDREAQIIFNAEIWNPLSTSSVGNVVRLDAACKNVRLNGVFHVLIDFREDTVGVIKIGTTGSMLQTTNIFDVVYTYERMEG